jgi:hypothetical protein
MNDYNLAMAITSEDIRSAELIIQAVSNGIALKRAAYAADMHIYKFHEVISSVRELSVRYARAREIMSDVEADEAKEIADDATLDPQHARNRIDIRKWRSSKHNSRVYGDRVDLNVQQSISISEALTDARLRLMRPVCDQLVTDDQSTIDCAIVSAYKPTDSVSDAEPGQVAGPDIFT